MYIDIYIYMLPRDLGLSIKATQLSFPALLGVASVVSSTLAAARGALPSWRFPDRSSATAERSRARVWWIAPPAAMATFVFFMLDFYDL